MSAVAEVVERIARAAGLWLALWLAGRDEWVAEAKREVAGG